MKLRNSIVFGACMLVTPSMLPAQEPNLDGPPVRLEGECPANGYHKPIYAGFGDNDGLIRGYEIANPCVLQQAIVAAEKLGMGRFEPIGVKNVQTIRFGASGSIALDAGSPARFSDVDIAISYGIPAMRITTRQGPEGSALSSAVFADGKAWNEDAPGINSRPAASGAAERRAPLHLLTPFGALLSIIEAEGHATASVENGHTVLSGTSPYDRLPVRLTLDDQNRPSSAEVTVGQDVYQATFSDYRDDWEPPYLVIFPAKITWTRNGQPYADLAVSRFKSNPYVIFPEPNLASAP